MSIDQPGCCEGYIEQLFSYLDGELDDEACTQLKAHLDGCSPCLDEYQRDALLKAVVRRSCQCEQAPAQLRTQIMAAIMTVNIRIEESR